MNICHDFLHLFVTFSKTDGSHIVLFIDRLVEKILLFSFCLSYRLNIFDSPLQNDRISRKTVLNDYDPLVLMSEIS